MAVFAPYSATFTRAMTSIVASGAQGESLGMDAAISAAHGILRRLADGPNKLMMIGNGGSAGIAGHMAIDFAKNGGIRALTFNDASSLTCLGNDLGYEQVFAKQVEMHAVAGDLLVAISSSGRSANILRAVERAQAVGCDILTLSGFDPENPLRRLGTVNFFVPTHVYGFVETLHQFILHAILDSAMGWRAEDPDRQPTATVAQTLRRSSAA